MMKMFQLQKEVSKYFDPSIIVSLLYLIFSLITHIFFGISYNYGTLEVVFVVFLHCSLLLILIVAFLTASNDIVHAASIRLKHVDILFLAWYRVLKSMINGAIYCKF